MLENICGKTKIGDVIDFHAAFIASLFKRGRRCISSSNSIINGIYDLLIFAKSTDFY